MRLFVAIAMPDAVRTSLEMLQSGVPGARWSPRENMHLTLRFIGEVDGRDAREIDEALATIAAPSFTLMLKGTGHFGGKNPSALWAGVEASGALLHLQRKIESALQRVGLDAEQRKFNPHVTLAYLRGAPLMKVMEFLSGHGLYQSPPFPVREFTLYESTMTPNGSLYVPMQSYPLA